MLLNFQNIMIQKKNNFYHNGIVAKLIFVEIVNYLKFGNLIVAEFH